MRNRLKDVDAFRRDWHAGLTLPQMAALHGISTTTVSVSARRLDLPRRRPGRRKEVGGSPAALTGGQWVRDDRGIQRWEASA